MKNDLEIEKKTNLTKKINTKDQKIKELKNFTIKKEKDEEDFQKNRKNDVNKLTLPLNNDEYVENHKNLMVKLIDKIDENINNFKEYKIKNKKSKCINNNKNILLNIKDENIINEKESDLKNNLSNILLYFNNLQIKTLTIPILVNLTI